jgi:hypothetical protein
MRLRQIRLLPVVLALIAPVAWACSACIRDIDPEEFDRRSWEAAPAVFIGRVTKAEEHLVGEENSEIVYDVLPEEVLKGRPEDVKRIFSRRPVNAWNSNLQMITCGSIAIAPGDRLLVVADSSSIAVLGGCTSSRVVEGRDAAPPAQVDATLKRLRKWSGQG